MNQTVVTKEKMNMGSTIAYAFGLGGTNVIWYMVSNYLLLFYTDVCTLSAGAISAMMLIARIWDAANDPMMGAIVDRTHTRWGRFKPYIALGAPFLAIFNILTFTVWPLEGIAKVVVCLLCYVGLGMLYTVVGVSINGLLNRLSNNPQIKMDIVAIAHIASSIVQMILGAVAMPLILYFSRSDVATGTGYMRASVIFSIACIPMLLICAFGCKEVKERTDKTETAAKETPVEKVPLSRSLKTIGRNTQLLICILNVFVGATAAMARMSLLSYYLIYVVGAFAFIAPVFTIISGSQIAGNVVLPFVTRRLGRIRTFVVFMLMNATSMLLLFFVPAGNIPVMLVLSAIYGFTNSGTTICFAMVCDGIEYGDYKFGTRDDALSFSMQSLAVKAATAITGAGGVLLLAAVGYVAGAEQAPSTVTGINAIVNLLPALLSYIGLVPMVFYKLNEKKMEEISTVLEARRSGHILPEDPLYQNAGKYNKLDKAH